MNRGILGKALLVLAIISCLLLAYSPRMIGLDFITPGTGAIGKLGSGYIYPMHADELSHISTSMAILKEGKFNYSPYSAESYQDREIGFHLLLAMLLIFPFINYTTYQYLAPLMLAVNAIFLFLLVKKLTKNEWIALASIPFLAAIKSNTNLLGNWYFVPLTATLPLIFIFIWRLDGWQNEPTTKNSAILAIIFLLAITAYPFAAITLALLFFSASVQKLKWFRKNIRKSAAITTTLAFISLLFIYQYFWTGTLAGTASKFLNELMFRQGWTELEYQYSLVKLHGTIPLLLAAIGIGALIKKNKAKALITWAGIHYIILLIFSLFKFSLLIPYQRNVFYFFVAIAPLSGAGLYYTAEFIHLHLKRLTKRTSESLAAALTTLLIAAVLTATFWNYYLIQPENFLPHRMITPKEYEGLQWLGNNAREQQMTVAEPFLALSIYPIAHQRTLGAISASTDGGLTSLAQNFSAMDCNAQKKTIEEHKINFVISRDRNSCAFLSQLYRNEEIFIYQTNQPAAQR